MRERTNERLEIITRKLGLLFSSSNLGEEEERITWVQSNIFNSTTNKRAPLFFVPRDHTLIQRISLHGLLRDVRESGQAAGWMGKCRMLLIYYECGQ